MIRVSELKSRMIRKLFIQSLCTTNKKLTILTILINIYLLSMVYEKVTWDELGSQDNHCELWDR